VCIVHASPVFSLIDGQMLTKRSQVGHSTPFWGMFTSVLRRVGKVEKCLPTPKFQAIKSL